MEYARPRKISKSMSVGQLAGLDTSGGGGGRPPRKRDGGGKAGLGCSMRQAQLSENLW